MNAGREGGGRGGMEAKADQDLVRRRNRALILHALRRRGPASRTELAARTGLSSATVSAITAEMLAEGALRRAAPAAAAVAAAPAPPAARGRPRAPLELAPDHCAVLAAGLWAGRISCALHDHAGRRLASRTRAIGAEAPGIGALLRDECLALLDETPDAPPLAAARISAQAAVDRAGRAILWSPLARLREPGLARPLERALGLPAPLLNDCAAMAEALHWRDAARFSGDFAVVLIGRGVGMGLFLHGRPFSGQRSSAAEFGHMNHVPGGAPCRCGRLGCVEAYAGDYAIRRAAGRAGADPFAPVADEEMAALAAAARAGPGRARDAFAAAGRAIGFGLGRVFALLGPAPVVVAGRGARAWDLLEGEARRGLAEALVAPLSGELEVEAVADEETLAMEGAALAALTALDAAGPLRLGAGGARRDAHRTPA